MGLLRLLGSPEFESEGRVWPLRSAKPLKLLTYLACKRTWVGREEVAELIWPEANTSTRLTRLRQMLRYVAEQKWCPELEVERLRLRWTKGGDVQNLQAACESEDWSLATRLYRGPLLVGLDLEEGEPYERWLKAERLRLRTLWLGAARQAACGFEGQGRLTEALEVWEAILREDGLAEDALCELLRLCLACGQMERGLAAYTAFQQRLWSEHRLEPASTTHAWLDRLRQAAASLSPVADGPLPTTPSPQDPIPATLFVGREAELAELVEWLDSENTGVLTLFGPGGVGKTRLAIETSKRSTCPSVFVPLVSLLKGQSVLAAVAQAMGKPLKGTQNAGEELRAQLQDMRLTLVLDNAEHLIEEVTALIALLEDSTQVKVLITSRLRLGLPTEKVLELSGLALESANSTESPALNLLFYAVRRARPGFAWSPYEAKVALRICHALDGVPLALELAGAWAKVFSLSEIAQRIEKMDFLEGSLQIPERHRGLRVVFAHSWQLLSESERKALCRLALFEGGFEVGAGLEVAQVSHQDLLALVDKAMLKIVGENQRRGDVHPLILEYAREQLTPNQREQTLERHAQYFLRFAEEAAPKLRGPDQVEWMERVQLEHPNLRLALKWWTHQGKAEGALRMSSALHWFWYVRGHYREGVDWLNAAMALPGADQYPEPYAEALRCAGALSSDLSEYPKAKELLLKALELWQRLQQPSGIARTQHHLGLLARDQGDLQQSRTYLQESIAAHRSLGDINWLATSLNDLAIIQAQLGEVKQARSLFEESLMLKEAVGDYLGVAYAYQNLGVIAHMEKKPFEAVMPLHEKSLTIKRQLGDLQGVANGLHNLGSLARQSKDPSARGYLSEALALRQKLGNRTTTTQTLCLFAKLVVDEGQPEKAAAIYGFLQGMAEKSGFQIHPQLKTSMEGLKESLEQTLGVERLAQAQASGKMLSMEQAIKLVELTPVL